MITPRKIARYGWRPDSLDQRDHVFKLARPAVALPKTFDLTKSMPPVYDQGDLGSCTANAIAAALQFDRRKQKLPDYFLSRLMIYLEERRIEGTINEDAGAEIRDGMKVCAKLGACDEKLWPYTISKFTKQPPAPAYKNALLTQALDYARVDQTALAIKRALYAGFPVVFGFAVYESFESNKVAQTGIVPMPGAHEAVIGGHAVALVGYEDAKKQFIVRNSWGTSWGIKGYFRMPYDYVVNPDLADDFWVVHAVG